jgi:GDPmannose 4,6-dehydratase
VANYRDAYGIWACSGILFNHESPLRPERFVTRKVIEVAKRIAAGSVERLVLGNIDIQRDWGWAPEYVDAMVRMLRLETAHDFVIATGESHSLREFVAEAFAQVGLVYQDYVSTDPELLRPSDILVSRGNPAKASAALHWVASTKMREIVRQMLGAVA